MCKKWGQVKFCHKTFSFMLNIMFTKKNRISQKQTKNRISKIFLSPKKQQFLQKIEYLDENSIKLTLPGRTGRGTSLGVFDHAEHDDANEKF
jgi:hypothetical protein